MFRELLIETRRKAEERQKNVARQGSGEVGDDVEGARQSGDVLAEPTLEMVLEAGHLPVIEGAGEEPSYARVRRRIAEIELTRDPRVMCGADWTGGEQRAAQRGMTECAADGAVRLDDHVPVPIGTVKKGGKTGDFAIDNAEPHHYC